MSSNDSIQQEQEQQEFTVRCHCGRVQGKFKCNVSTTTNTNNNKLIAWDCDCSDCFMRRNVHLIVPERDFTLDMKTGESLEDATILYQWGTKTAVRRFCKTCGILPWYRPRSNPDGYGISVYCVDWTKGGTIKPPELEIHKFNGVEWEKTIQEMKEGARNVNITEQSK